MKNTLQTLAFAGLLVALLAACVAKAKPEVKIEPAPGENGRSTIEATPNTDVLPDGLTLGDFVEVDGARIYALIDKNAPAETIYTTLDEAMADKVCTIREVGATTVTDAEGQQQEVAGDVNTLLITNTGDKPIFLMAGDLVLGGKQDRILAESLVVAPDTDSMKIPVFCVEHGRWTPQRKDGAVAMSGYFENTKGRGQVDMSVKMAALASADQSEVWKSVAKSNEALGVAAESAGGTFRATFDNKAVAGKIDKNYQAAKVLNGKGVVGFIVYVKGEAVAMDAFESVALCEKLSEKLLRSYIVTGINGGYSRDLTGISISRIRSGGFTTSLGVGTPVVIADEATYFIHDIAATGENTEVVELWRQTLFNVELRRFITATELLDQILVLEPQLSRASELRTELVEVAGNPNPSIVRRISGSRPAVQFLEGVRVATANVESWQAAGMRNVALESRRISAPTTSETPAIERSTTPNDRTDNRSDISAKAVKYTCKDKKTGKAVQRSFMRR